MYATWNSGYRAKNGETKSRRGKRQCNCCPYGYHLDLDFVRYCEKVANHPLLPGPSSGSLRRLKIGRRKRESIETLLGVDNHNHSIKQITKECPGTEEKGSQMFVSRETEALEKAVLDFERMLKSSREPPKKIITAETLMFAPPSGHLHYLESYLDREKEKSYIDNSSSNNSSGIVLQDIRTQMATCLNRMRELEEEVKCIPILRTQIKRLHWENLRLTKQMESEKQTSQNEKLQNMREYAEIQKRDVGISCIALTREVGVASTVSYNTIGTDPLNTQNGIISKPETSYKDVETNTNINFSYFNEIKISSDLNNSLLKKKKTFDKAVQDIRPCKDVSVQVSMPPEVKIIPKPFIYSSSTQTCKINFSKDIGISINSMDNVEKRNIGVNTVNLLQNKKTISFSQYTDTKGLLLKNDVSVNTAKKKLVSISVDTLDLSSENLKKPEKENFIFKKQPKSHLKTPSNKINLPPESVRHKKEEDKDEAAFSKVDDLHKYQKREPSKEMKAAMKVLNDSLQKSPSVDMPKNMRNAINIIQQEWFKVSSVKDANPLDVEDYLDCFEELSVGLLEYVVNLTDMSGNTAMHYAVSNGNFDVVSILLDSKVCNINKLNTAGYTCIMLVALTKVKSETDRQVVRRLFQMSDVNIRAKQHGQTALMLAVSHGRIDTVELLLECGADINIQDEDGSTALMCAAEHGYIDIVKLLLAQPDCDLSITDLDGSTALNIAMEAGNRDIGVLLYAQEHFSRGSSPFGSLKPRRAKSATPTFRTRSPSSPNRSQEHSF